MKVANIAYRGFEVLYGLYFIFIGFKYCQNIAEQRAIPQVSIEATRLMNALEQSHFVIPLLIVNYLFAGLCIVCGRLAHVGALSLVPSVTVILLFHIFLTSHIYWGLFWALGLISILFRYRRAYFELVGYRDI